MLCAVFVSCTASYPTEPSIARPVGLLLLYSEPRGRVAAAGGTQNQYSFSAVTVDNDGAYQFVDDRVTWLSTDDSVMQHTSRGTYVAVGPGTAQAIARYEGFEASAPMMAVNRGLLDDVYPRLNVVSPGTRPQAWVRRGPASNQSTQVTSQASWSSSDPRVATVGSTGVVTTLGVGTTLITVSFDGLTDWYWLSVAPR